MRNFFIISLLFVFQSCVPVLIHQAIKESKRIEQEADEILKKHNLSLKYDESAGYQKESSIYSQDGKELIFIKRFVEHYRTGNINQNTNEDWQSRTYFHVVFLESQTTIELERFSVQNVILTLEQNNIFEFGRLNNEAIDYMVLKYGITRFRN